MSSRRIRVILADEQELVRVGFRSLMEREPGLEVVGEACDGREAVNLALSLQPDVLLVDLNIQGIGGIEVTRRLHGDPAARSIRTLILSSRNTDDDLLSALQAGASGYLLKSIRACQLIEAIVAVADGGAVLSPLVTRQLLDRFTRSLGPLISDRTTMLTKLTEREVEVLQSLAYGRSNREIAEDLHVTEATVKSHLSNLLGKLGLRDRVQAVLYAQQAGIAHCGSSRLDRRA